jgi:flagellar assembly factor FliW
MKIQNKQFGEIEYEPNSIINFEDGILGFEDLKKFILVAEKDGYFFWLTAVDEPEIVFPLFSINMLQEEYENDSEMEPFGIVKLDKDPQNMSINLKAPVFINHDDRTGYQRIIDNEEYPVDYPLFVKNEN